MPIDNRHFIIEDLPPDPEELLHPEEDDDDDFDDLDLDLEDTEEAEPGDELPFDSPPSTKRKSFMEETRSYPWSTRTWGQERQAPPPSTPWSSYQSPASPWQQRTWGATANNNTSQRVGESYGQTGQYHIDRRKKILFVDLLDILIESESAIRESGTSLSPNNNYRRDGVMPRGLYDIRLKLEVWSKLVAFSPDYVFCISNQPHPGKEKKESWDLMIKYVMSALAEYLRLPTQSCKCLIKFGFSRDDNDVKPGTGLIKKALSLLPQNYRYQREDLVVIGANSGYANQSNIDRIMAERAGIDYLDVMDLLTAYN